MIKEVMNEEEILKNIEKVTSGMNRDGVKLSIDVLGSLTKLFYTMADEEKIDNILASSRK